MLIEILTSSTGDLQSGPGDHLHSKQPFKITVFKLSFVDWVAVLLLLFAYDCALDHLLDFPVLPTSGRHNEGASRICEWETLAAISVNKGCCSHQAITPDGEPWGDSGWKQMPAIKQSTTAGTPNGAPRGDAGWESTGYLPQRAEMHIKWMISMSPNFCIFSYIEKH